MTNIRKAEKRDISRIAEILVFSKRTNYRSIFHNDKVSFGEIQVLPLTEEFLTDLNKLSCYYVFDDEFVKGLIKISGGEIVELYVDTFFVSSGIGQKLITFAKSKGAKYLWVLEKNARAIKFYERNGFKLTKEKKLEKGTEEFIVKMELN